MSVLSYLEDLASNAILKEDEKSSIEKSINTLKLRLDNYFGNELKEHFKFGSSTRDTILPRNMDSHSDIDYMVVFEDDSFKPQTYLDKLKRFVEAKYSTSEIYQSNPTIVLNLNHIKFELVPAIDKGYFSNDYRIPAKASDYNDWIQTDPNGFNDELTNKNKNNNFQIKPMIRLIKYWNANNDHMFYSFLLEKDIVGKFYFNCNNLKEYFYYYMENFGTNSDYSDVTNKKIEKMHKIIRETKNLENQGYHYSAEEKIKELLPIVGALV